MSDSEEEKQEVELAEWVQIQKKTFTRWCNEQLKVKELAIDDLSTGLKDGVNLVHLVGLLTQKPAKRYKKEPRMRVQMMENIGFALDILNKDGIKLVNIGREDICDGNIKLILGLIWTLILHYQISVDFGGDSEGKKNTTAKKELQNWASGLINSLQEDTGGKKVKNFTTDWNDGIALCTMVEAVAPGLCPEYSTLDPKNALDNVKLGFDRAEEGLGVAKIIEVEDMVNPLIDELSVLTYVSLLKSASPKIDIQKPDPLKVRIYGPGVDTAYINSPTEFFIDFKNAGFGKLDVKILDGKGEEVPIELWKKDGETRVQYAPTEPGKLKFNVLYNGTLVPNGDAIVRVLTPSDVNGVKLSGDGLNSGVVGKESEFVADVTDAGDGDLDVSIVGVDGKIPVKLDVQESDRKLVMVKFTPTKAGPTLITVKFNNEELPESPLHVEVVDDIDPLKVKILAVGVGDAEVNKPVKFIVSTEGAGNGDLKVKVLDKDGVPLKVTVEDLDGENKQVTFTPQEPGDLHVSVKWSDKTVPNGEFDVEVHKPLDLKACIVTNLKNPIVGIPTRFSVDLSKVGSDDLAVEAVDKNGDPLNVVIDDIGDLKYQVTYTAQEPGPVKLNVKIEDQHLPGSAFTVYGVDPSKVVIDLDKEHEYTVGEPVEIGLDMTEAGPGQLDVQLAAPVGSGTDCSAAEVSPGKMVVTFTPTEPGEHNIKLTLDDQQIPSTPICLTVRPKPNAGQVNVNGEGVREGEVGKPSVFTVDTSKAGPGNLDVKVKGPKDPLTCNIIEVGDGLYEVTYVPKEEGPHVVAVKFADQHVPGSAFRPNVLKGLNPDNVVAYGKGLEEDQMESSNLTDTALDEKLVIPTPTDSFSLLEAPFSPQPSIDPATVLPPDQVSTTSEDISILAEEKSDLYVPSPITSEMISEVDELRSSPNLGRESTRTNDTGNIFPESDKDSPEGSTSPESEDSVQVISEIESTAENNNFTVQMAEKKELEETRSPTETTHNADADVTDESGGLHDSTLKTQASDEEPVVEEVKRKQKKYPLIHAACTGALGIFLTGVIANEKLSLSTPGTILASCTLPYFATAMLADFETLASEEVLPWLQEAFNLVILPGVLVNSGSLFYDYLQSESIPDADIHSGVLFALLSTIESLLIKIDLKSIGFGFAGILSSTGLWNAVSGIGEAEPLIPDD